MTGRQSRARACLQNMIAIGIPFAGSSLAGERAFQAAKIRTEAVPHLCQKSSSRS